MTPKEKALELVDKFRLKDKSDAQQCALIAVENEYKEKRELLFLLKTNQAINANVYLHFLDHLINEEKEVKQEIEKL
jgi:hypothetical protein